MLTITVVLEESWDEENEEFVVKSFTLDLEHSLVSLSKWESIHETPFLNEEEKTEKETLSYVECMILDRDYPEDIVQKLSADNLDEINAYVNAKRTATWFSEPKFKEPKKRPETITSELVYYWMIALEIPSVYEEWHLNRLLTLIQICNLKNTPSEKVKPSEAAARRRALNEERKARLKTQG